MGADGDATTGDDAVIGADGAHAASGDADAPVVAGFFSGCGGLDLGFERAGFDVALGSDQWEPAAETYRRNFPDTEFVEEDVRELDAPAIREAVAGAGYDPDGVDVVIGGPPCQGFSRLNNEQIELDEMEKDRRNTLFEEFLRVVSVLEPQLVLMENVRDLINRQTSDDRYVKDLIVDEFAAHGYKCEYRVLEAEQYGVPQKRRRIFFMGTDRDVPIRFPEPTTPEGQWRTAGEALADATDDLPNMTYADTGEKTLERIRHVPPGGYYRDLPDRLKTKKYQCDCEDTDTCPHEPEIVKRYGTYLRRLDPEEPSLTVSTNVFIHPSEDRYLTPREMARLQTFPDEFVFEGTKTDVMKQIGNAVPVRLGEELANQLLEYFPEVRDAPPADPDVYEQQSLTDLA
ncbi:DNA cytosine methyltransferase [Halorubrum distributum]|uniref:DNA (cytosine-5-)-methyltransferase n=1 Tax=Halorubrum distributum TaxID=29283 RepID=A0A6B1ILT6_9EURY|nr:DNA cytosine methyltransferase [Halorubrum terrestre]MYL16690.1 DNA (cytosine-5-)-methyltransferase [Halorubrum terrestre]MYL66996.1 DNA (cytosine-5-)-methyltransferase [Halorubrum terrestre]